MHEKTTPGSTAVQVRDFAFLNDDFRDALDRYIGPEARTRLAQLGTITRPTIRG